MTPRPFDFNDAILRDVQIKTFRAERQLLLKELIETNSRQKAKFSRISDRLKIVNRELFKLTGRDIYR
jgi:hypothetical protein